VGDETLIGMGAVILDGAVVGNQCLIGAKALSHPAQKFPVVRGCWAARESGPRLTNKREPLKYWREICPQRAIV